jgi:hypothetical protein
MMVRATTITARLWVDATVPLAGLAFDGSILETGRSSVAANGQPQHFGWEIFGGVRYATRLSGGSCRTFAAAKRAAEAAFHALSK